MRPARILSALALSLTLGTAGCDFVEIASSEGGPVPPVDEDAEAPAGDEPIMAPDIPVMDTLQQDPRLVTAQPESVGETFPIFLQEATVAGTTLRVSFSGGTAPCFVIGYAEAVESEDSVIVDVRAGAAAGTDQATCTTAVEMQQTEIELTRELGDRLLLDGSRVHQGDGDAQY